MRYAQFPPQRAEFREWWCGLREESIWRGPREALPVFRSSRLVYSFSLVKNSCCVDEALLLMVALALWVAGEKKNGELRMSFSFFLQCTKEARETSIETAALRTGVSSVRRVREASRFAMYMPPDYTTIAFAPSPTRNAPLLSTLPLPKFDERFPHAAPHCPCSTG